MSEIEEYEPGKGVEEIAEKYDLKKEDIIEISSNENPLGPPQKVVEDLKTNLDKSSKYPKKIQERARNKIADYINISSENLALGAGADGIFDNINKLFLEKEDAILTPQPGFSYYGLSAKSFGASENSYNLSKSENFEYSVPEILESYENEKIVYITTPNNPTGTSLHPNKIRKIANKINALIVIDEAYKEFSESKSSIDLALEKENIIVVRTFSKSFGLAGLRIGYTIAKKDMISSYRKVSPPFSTSNLSFRASIAAIEDKKHLKKSIELAQWGRKYIRNNLEAKTFPSKANFVLAEVGDSDKICSKLEKKGILVRNTASFGLPKCIRIGVGRKKDTKKATEKINQILKQK